MLAGEIDGTCNDAKWYQWISDALLIGFPDIKAAFDAQQDLEDLPPIDRNAWAIEPVFAVLPIAAVAADVALGIPAVPAIAGIPAFPGRLRYAVGADGYMTADAMN